MYLCFFEIKGARQLLDCMVRNQHVMMLKMLMTTKSTESFKDAIPIRRKSKKRTYDGYNDFGGTIQNYIRAYFNKNILQCPLDYFSDSKTRLDAHALMMSVKNKSILRKYNESYNIKKSLQARILSFYKYFKSDIIVGCRNTYGRFVEKLDPSVKEVDYELLFEEVRKEVEIQIPPVSYFLTKAAVNALALEVINTIRAYLNKAQPPIWIQQIPSSFTRSSKKVSDYLQNTFSNQMNECNAFVNMIYILYL